MKKCSGILEVEKLTAQAKSHITEYVELKFEYYAHYTCNFVEI